eukprot:3254773-Pyramimonas_sp.AAC.1
MAVRRYTSPHYAPRTVPHHASHTLESALLLMSGNNYVGNNYLGVLLSRLLLLPVRHRRAGLGVPGQRRQPLLALRLTFRQFSHPDKPKRKVECIVFLGPAVHHLGVE